MKYFTIKPITSGDFEILEKIDKSIFPLKSQQTTFSKTQTSQNKICYVAHSLSKTETKRSIHPVGYITILFTNIESEILSFAVAENYRGYGIGKGLIALTLKKLIASDCQSVFLEVRNSNKAAKGIYSKFGFSKIGVRPHYYSDNHEDAILMSLHHIQNAGFLSFLQSTLDDLPYCHQAGN